MEIKQVKEVKNPLFSRKEYHFEVKSDVAPSHEEIKKILGEKFSFDQNLTRIKLIKGRFGTQIFDVSVNLYSSQEEFNRVVKKTKQEVEAEKKKAEEEAKAKAEAEAEAQKPKEEKPVEPVEETPVKEAKEEKVKEEKPVEEKKE